MREVGEPFATERETYLHLMETSFLQRCRRLSQSGKQEVHIPVDLEPDTKPREQHLSWMLAAWWLDGAFSGPGITGLDCTSETGE